MWPLSCAHDIPLLCSCDPSLVLMWSLSCALSCDHVQTVGRGWVHSLVGTTHVELVKKTSLLWYCSAKLSMIPGYSCTHYLNCISALLNFSPPPAPFCLLLPPLLPPQQLMNVSGNQDICYHNTLCSHPIWSPDPSNTIIAFNNIVSNIGYLVLGILIILLAYRR